MLRWLPLSCRGPDKVAEGVYLCTGLAFSGEGVFNIPCCLNPGHHPSHTIVDGRRQTKGAPDNQLSLMAAVPVSQSTFIFVPYVFEVSDVS